MSGSPKYTSFSLESEVLQRLLAARQQQAALERQKREAEEARRVQQRLDQARDGARTDLAAARRDLDAFAAHEAARFAPAGKLDSFRQRLSQAEKSIGSMTTEDQGRRVRSDLGRLHDELRQARAEAESARLASQLAAEAAQLAGLRQQLAAIDAARAARFDPHGRQQLEAQLSRCDGLLQRKALDQATSELTEARRQLQEHQSVVEQRFSRWTQERDQAVAALAQASDRVAGLRVDPVVSRWSTADAEALAARCRRADDLLAREDFAACRQEAAALAAEVDRLVALAGETQFKEDQRQYIVRGIVETMGQLGLVVQAGYPQPEHRGVAASATIIQAQRVGGGSIAVSVPQEGEIWYDVDGFPMRVEGSATGYARTCDEAEEQINRMHDAMLAAFGIESSELTWDDKDPDRIRKTAKALPGSSGAQQKRGG